MSFIENDLNSINQQFNFEVGFQERNRDPDTLTEEALFTPEMIEEKHPEIDAHFTISKEVKTSMEAVASTLRIVNRDNSINREIAASLEAHLQKIRTYRGKVTVENDQVVVAPVEGDEPEDNILPAAGAYTELSSDVGVQKTVQKVATEFNNCLAVMLKNGKDLAAHVASTYTSHIESYIPSLTAYTLGFNETVCRALSSMDENPNDLTELPIKYGKNLTWQSILSFTLSYIEDSVRRKESTSGEASVYYSSGEATLKELKGSKAEEWLITLAEAFRQNRFFYDLLAAGPLAPSPVLFDGRHWRYIEEDDSGPISLSAIVFSPGYDRYATDSRSFFLTSNTTLASVVNFIGSKEFIKFVKMAVRLYQTELKNIIDAKKFLDEFTPGESPLQDSYEKVADAIGKIESARTNMRMVVSNIGAYLRFMSVMEKFLKSLMNEPLAKQAA